MNSKLFKKEDLYKKCKIDEQRFTQILADGILENKELFTEEDVEDIRTYRKEFPFMRDEIQRRYKIDNQTMELFVKKKMILGKYFFSEKETEVFKSFNKLKRLGYNNSACLKVLEEVGIPEEEDLFKDSSYIQLKDLAELTEISERTIKFYEKTNIIKKPKTYKNKRFYKQKVKKELELIRDLQHIGYKLNDIAKLLESIRKEPSLGNDNVTRVKSELLQKKLIIDQIILKLKELV